MDSDPFLVKNKTSPCAENRNNMVKWVEADLAQNLGDGIALGISRFLHDNKINRKRPTQGFLYASTFPNVALSENLKGVTQVL